MANAGQLVGDLMRQCHRLDFDADGPKPPCSLLDDLVGRSLDQIKIAGSRHA
jgi:hypothetical protein